jgi:hypothetical protein
MGYYLIKRNQEVEGSSNLDFYFYENEISTGTENQAHWGTDSSVKKIFDTLEEAESIFNNEQLVPPNFLGAEIVEES